MSAADRSPTPYSEDWRCAACPQDHTCTLKVCRVNRLSSNATGNLEAPQHSREEVIQALSAAVIEGQAVCDANKRQGWTNSFWEMSLLPWCREALRELNALPSAEQRVEDRDRQWRAAVFKACGNLDPIDPDGVERAVAAHVKHHVERSAPPSSIAATSAEPDMANKKFRTFDEYWSVAKFHDQKLRPFVEQWARDAWNQAILVASAKTAPTGLTTMTLLNAAYMIEQFEGSMEQRLSMRDKLIAAAKALQSDRADSEGDHAK